MSMTGRRPLLSSRLSSGSNQPKSHLMQRRGKESEAGPHRIGRAAPRASPEAEHARG